MASKRHLSPAPLPPPKRQHGVALPFAGTTVTSFDNALSDELVLFIFSFLDARALCAVQAINKNCSRLACDNQLWRALFITDFGKARLRGGRGFYGRPDGRIIKGLPSRAPLPTDHSSESLNWRWMYRVSSNWRNGRCVVDNLEESAPASSLLSGASGTHVRLSGALTISASPELFHQPTILLRPHKNAIHTLKCRSSITAGPVRISTIAIDQSRPSPRTAYLVRFAAFLSTGEFSIYEYSPSSLCPSPKFAYVPLPRHRSHVAQAAYHHPLLVTLSHTFTLMLYDLSGDTITHTHSLSSFTSYPPTSLILSAMPSSASYKLVLAYATPVYPAHWSIGVTELIISSSGSIVPTVTSSSSTLSSANFTVSGTRTARAFDVPHGWIDDEKLRAMRAQWGRKVKQVAETQTDGKWVVLAPGDASELLSDGQDASSDASSFSAPSPSPSAYVSPASHTSAQLQLYRLYMPPLSSSQAPRLSFVRTLHGPVGPVSALALADGRCVSLGVNGSIWVWDLEGGDGTEIAGPVLSERANGRATIVFDERRIVTSGLRGTEERRFDI